MDFFNKKTFMQAQIAMKLDEYFYEKDAQTYFETMPHIGLFDSQVSNVNTYIHLVSLRFGFGKVLYWLI